MEHIKFGGYYPGLIGDMIRLHGQYYADNYGYDRSFESQEAQELGEFGLSYNPQRDCWLSARWEGEFVGSVVVDGRQHPEFGARLRWFIVEPSFQGRGLGWRLLSNAVTFCRQRGYERLHLLTVKGLDAAKSLYLKVGFCLDHEEALDQWGLNLVEQRYLMNLQSAAKFQPNPSRACKALA